MSESTELVVIEPTKARELFTKEKGLEKILADVKANLKLVAPDTSTTKGREQIRSLAFRVTKSKTHIEKMGKEISAELKELPKIVDANRKQAIEFLESLATEVRQPLTDWEAEQERLKAEEEAKAAAIKLAEQVERDHELALLMNKEFDREQEEKRIAEAAQIEAERLAKIERERLIAENAAKQAKEQAEREAKELAERVARDAKEANEKAERDRIAAQVRAEQAEAAQKAAEARHAAQIEQAKMEAETARLKAIDDEKARVAAEAKRVADEQAKRESDTKHKSKINRAALDSLIAKAGLTDEQAKKVVTAIVKGQIDHVSIQY